MDRRTCFIIGPIGNNSSETRQKADFLLNGIIRPALLEIKDLKIWRADEDSRPGMITDKLINDIYDADIVIADLTELNPNAFYELGIRHAASKPTIHVAELGTNLPFDNLGHRTIFFNRQDWKSIEESRRHVYDQINQIFQSDFIVSNPVTQALTTKAFMAEATPKEKMLAQLSERVETLEAMFSDSLNSKNKLDYISSNLSLILRDILLSYANRNNIKYSRNDISDIIDAMIARHGQNKIMTMLLHENDRSILDNFIFEETNFK